MESCDLKIVLSLTQIIQRQKDFSLDTFGPGKQTLSKIKHIKSELEEIELNPGDLFEWVDVMILAMDGAWRQGFTPLQIAKALVKKQDINMKRTWPDWRTEGINENEPTEHVK